jgi:hypothetical protein
MTTTKKDQKQLEVWKADLWAMWEAGVRLGWRPISLKTMKDAFYAGFDSGRNSVDIIKRIRKKSHKTSKRK